jgi:hypothetical protein
MGAENNLCQLWWAMPTLQLPAENPETKMFIGDLQKAVMSEFQHK